MPYSRAHLSFSEVCGLIEVIFLIVCSMTISVTGEIFNILKLTIMTNNMVTSGFTTIFRIGLEALPLLLELWVPTPPYLNINQHV